MLALLHSLGMFVVDLFMSRRRLVAENLFLRHQLSIALRRAPPRLRLRGSDRALLVWMTRLWPSLLGAAQVVQPETILRWHRAGFTAFWRWKSRKRAGRPKIDRDLRDLIRRMSRENPKWGASRIHGELLMLGFEVAQSTVSKYMVQGGPRSQGWKTFLRNHAQAIAAIDLCVVPTLTFERLFAFLVLGHGRRQLLWFEVTRHPTAEWLARQITEAFPWASAPAYLVRDNDRAYGHIFTSRVRAMGIRDRPISPGSPWQNPYVERLIGTVRRECLDRMLIFGESHLRQILSSYAAYYNEVRTHLLWAKTRLWSGGAADRSHCRHPNPVRTTPPLRPDIIFRKDNKDSPVSRPVQQTGCIVSHALLGGLHHHTLPNLIFGTHNAPFTRQVERHGDIVAYPVLGGLHDRYARI
jgi:transposase InsO family protein